MTDHRVPHIANARTSYSDKSGARGLDMDPLATWSKGGLVLKVFNAANAPGLLAGAYAVLYAGVFRNYHAYLNAPDMTKVFSKDNGLALACSGDDVLAGLYYSRSLEKSGSKLKVMGLVSSGKVSGLAAPLVSAVAISEMETCSAQVSVHAIVRVMPNQRINFSSARALSRAGLVPLQTRSMEIDQINAHLHLSVEPNSKHYNSLEMAGDHRDLLAAGKVTLAAWMKTGEVND